MALEIVAAKDLNHAFEIVSVSPEKTMEHHVVSEPEEIADFLYDTRNELTNYTYYYQFDPYREIQLEADQVPAIKTFSQPPPAQRHIQRPCRTLLPEARQGLFLTRPATGTDMPFNRATLP